MAIGLMGLTACSIDTECRQDMQVYLRVALQGDSIAMNEDSVAYHTTYTSIKGISVQGVGRDSLILDEATTSTLLLPLKKTEDACAFAITYQAQTDTLYLAYAREEVFVSLACGCAVMATIDTAYTSHTFIDSLEVLNTAVSTAPEKHIKLYLHKP